jgi:outer membrane protein assembly factor BamE (lipoprotein component of BamABCDE complex)
MARPRTQSLQSFRTPTVRDTSVTVRRAPMRLTLLLAAGLWLGGCSIFAAPQQVRGNKVDPDVLAELVPGTSSRADVTALLGSPTAKGTFDENVWLYIGSVTRTRVARTQAMISMDVVKLTFDDAGVLRGIERLNMDDSLPVSVVARTTPSPGSDLSVMQQLFGNIGRFGAGGGGGPSPGTGGTR